jgi:hypothetical protein
MTKRKLAGTLALVLLLDALFVSYSPRTSGFTKDSQLADNVTYRLFTTNGIFELTFENGTTLAMLFGAGRLASVNLTQSLISANQDGFDVNLTTSYDSFYISPKAEGTLSLHSFEFETHVIRVTSPSMEIFNGNLSLGYYYLWLPHSYANNSQITNYLTVKDVRDVRYDFAGQLVEKSGFDYVTVVNQMPLVSVINIYNASTGQPISLMIPGGSGFSIAQVESGNFTLGITNLGYTPLGILLNYNWFDFYTVTPHGLFVATEYLPHLQTYLNFVSDHGFALTSQPTPVTAWPVTIVAVTAFALVVLATGVFFFIRRRNQSMQIPSRT